MWAAFTLPIVWLAVLMAGCYEPGMTIFDLVAQFTEVTKMPFALHWTPYTMKFIGIDDYATKPRLHDQPVKLFKIVYLVFVVIALLLPFFTKCTHHSFL